jgi:hypothetical protein
MWNCFHNAAIFFVWQRLTEHTSEPCIRPDGFTARNAELPPVHSDLAATIRTAWAWHEKAHPLKTGEPVRGQDGAAQAIAQRAYNGLICTLRHFITPEPYCRANGPLACFESCTSTVF